MLKGLGQEFYGLWVFAGAAAGVLSFLDVLGWTVTREVAGLNDQVRDTDESSVTTLSTAYLGFGAVGAVIILSLGLLAGSRLYVSHADNVTIPFGFAFLGIAFFGDQVSAFVTAVLHGLRRFTMATLLNTAQVIIQASGITLLLNVTHEFVPITVWQAGCSCVFALFGSFILARVAPRFRVRVGCFYWAALRRHLSFGASTLAITGAGALVWQAPRMLIAFTLGSSAVVPYHVGQRFPLEIGSITTRIGEVLFPAARQGHVRGAGSELRILDVGTRWNLVLTLPLCLLVWLIGPDILAAWLGEAPIHSIAVLRVTTIAIGADGLAVGALSMLWACGSSSKVARVCLASAVLGIGVGMVLVPRWGVVGVSLGVLLASIATSAALLYLAAPNRPVVLTRAVFKGLPVPLAVCAISEWLAVSVIRPHDWPHVLLVVAVGGGIYILILYLFGAREEERILIREPVVLSVKLCSHLCQRVFSAVRLLNHR
jgi:O-antigen/teichoic acid export membrane protein